MLSGLLTPLASGQTLRLWEQEKEDIQAVLDKLIVDFEKANPKIKIKRSHYKNEDLRTQFQTSAMGGGGGDLVLAPNDFGGPFAIMGIIKPVQKLVDLSKFGETVKSAVADTKGNFWAVPVSRGNHLMLFVNKAIVKKAPETIEELVAIAKKTSNAKENKFGFAYNLTEPFWFVAFMGAYGTRPLVNAQPQLDNEGMIKALSLVKDFKFKDKIVPPDCGYACAETLFLEGKVAMIINGDWAVSKYQESMKDNLIIAPLPKSAATGQYMEPMISGKYLFVNNKLKGKKLAAAKKFIEFMTSEEIQRRLIRETGRLPALKSLIESKEITGDPVLKAINDAMAHGQPMPMDVELRVIWDAIRPQLQAVMADRAEPKAAAKIMQKDAVTKIKEMREM